jgi:predicted Zn-dependent protease
MKSYSSRILPVGLGVVLSVAIGLSQTAPKHTSVYSPEKERALGEHLAEEVERTSEMMNDPVVTDYVQQLARKLAQDYKFPITLKVVRSNDVSASVIPGGFLYPTSGLLARAETEAQMAGILAHEIAHIRARQWRQVTQGSQILNTDSVPLVFMASDVFCARLDRGYAIPAAVLSSRTELEKEADRLGLEYLYKAGYDPAGLVEIFAKLQSEGKISLAVPMDVEDQKHELELFEPLVKKAEYKVTSSKFDEMRARLLAATGRAKPARPPSLRNKN